MRSSVARSAWGRSLPGTKSPGTVMSGQVVAGCTVVIFVEGDHGVCWALGYLDAALTWTAVQGVLLSETVLGRGQ